MNLIEYAKHEVLTALSRKRKRKKKFEIGQRARLSIKLTAAKAGGKGDKFGVGGKEA